MEDDPAPGDAPRKFQSSATDASTTHVFLIWPRDCQMAGTHDELVMWQTIQELTGTAPECYLFHQTGVLRVEQRGDEQEVLVLEEQGKSPYLRSILERGVYEQEWTELEDLRRQVREVLTADLGVPPRAH